jgi:diguanylate cyclase (GGDEF)-like protein
VAVSTSLRRFWAWLIAPPDEVIADAARDGELLVARVRSWLTLLLLAIPVFSLAINPAAAKHWLGLAVAGTAFVAAVLIEKAVQRGLHRPGLPFATTIADVSIISLGLLAFWFIGLPIVATNSRVVFEAYFVAIAASALRYSPPVCLVAGGTAITQYLILSLLTPALFSEQALAVGAPAYGAFDPATQAARLVLMLAMTVMALTIVDRTIRLRRQGTFDRLTGLFNRAYAEEYLGPELVRSARMGDTVVIAMLDVDKFKPFNDTHGHAAGDAALREMARLLRGTLRRSDVIARFGGEEILIVMPGTTLPAALEKLDEVRVAIGLKEIPLPRGGTGHITVSIGAAAYPGDGTTPDELLDVADARLYVAKEAGRNRIVATAQA